MLKSFFNTVLYQPLLSALVFFYQYLPGHDFGVAVIVLTILIKLVLSPLTLKSMKSQKLLAELQPKIQEIQRKFKDKQQQAKETMALYKEAKINPFSGFLLILVQIPIFFALYKLFSNGFQNGQVDINPTFLNVINLSEPSIALAIITGVSQFFQAKLWSSPPKTQQQTGQMANFMNLMQKQMLYFFPIIIVFILWKLPAALGLYWTVSNIFSIFQQYFTFRKLYAKPGKP